MNKNDYIFCLERKEEYREVENLVREAFWNVYRPGCLEHYVLNQLRDDKAFVPELDFVMEKDGQLIGQNLVVGHYALKVISISMEKVDSHLQVSLVFVITVCQRMQIYHSFFARN